MPRRAAALLASVASLSSTSATAASASSSWPLITSPTNSRLKQLKRLHVRRQREKEGLVLLEGHRLVLDALEAGLEPDFVVLHDDALTHVSGPRLQAALEAACPPERVLRVPRELINSLSDTQTPQGILAVVPQAAMAVPLPRRPTLVLVCDGVADPGNLGTLLRSACGAGVGATLLTPGCCDPWGLKALRAGMGAQCRLPMHQCDWVDASALLRSWGCTAYAADAGGEVPHDLVDWSAPSALVVGSEAHGLSDLVRGDKSVALCRIPLGGVGTHTSDDGLESLNAAVAGSVILFEAQRQRRIAAAVLGSERLGA